MGGGGRWVHSVLVISRLLFPVRLLFLPFVRALAKN